MDLEKYKENISCYICRGNLYYFPDKNQLKLFCPNCDNLYLQIDPNNDSWIEENNYFLKESLENGVFFSKILRCPFIFECPRKVKYCDEVCTVSIGICSGNVVFSKPHSFPDGKICPLKKYFLDAYSEKVETLLNSGDISYLLGKKITVRELIGEDSEYSFGLFGEIIDMEKRGLIIKDKTGKIFTLGGEEVVIIIPHADRPLI
ncbi:MAG: hypothetical protein V3574_04200 [Candidatus Moraniibacteriota bacterium]